MELGEPDVSGRRRPIPIPGSESRLAADASICAIGNSPNPLVPMTTPGLAVGKDGTMYHTIDGGGEWTKVTASGFPVDEDFYKISFFNENLGYVLGYGGVYKTENAGRDWVNNWLPVVPYRGAWDMSFPNDRTGYLLGSRYTDPDPSLLYRTTNGGASWAAVAVAPAVRAVGAPWTNNNASPVLPSLNW